MSSFDIDDKDSRLNDPPCDYKWMNGRDVMRRVVFIDVYSLLIVVLFSTSSLFLILLTFYFPLASL